MPSYVVGHKTPDTDSIVSAIALSYLKNQIGEEVVPVRQGVITPETNFILETFGVHLVTFGDVFTIVQPQTNYFLGHHLIFFTIAHW